jgi:PAS domain S-box-containing protein
MIRRRITSILLFILSGAGLILFIFNVVTGEHPSEQPILGCAIIIFDAILLAHLRGWRQSNEATVLSVVLLIIIGSDPEYLRDHISLLPFIPVVVAAILLAPRWTLAVYSITTLGIVIQVWIHIGAISFEALGPTYSFGSFVITTLIACGITLSSVITNYERHIAQRQTELATAAQAQSERQAHELLILDRVRTAIAAELDLSALYRTVVATIANTMGHSQVSLYRYEGDSLILEHQIGFAATPTHISIADKRIDIPLLAIKGQAEKLLIETTGISSEIRVPLFNQHDIAGVIRVGNDSKHDLNEDDLRLMSALSRQISIAIGRAHLHAEVQRREQQYRSVVDNIKEVLFEADIDGHWTFLSPAWCDITGFTVAESLGRRFSEFILPEALSATTDEFNGLLARGDTQFRFETRYRIKDGGFCWIEVHAQLRFIDGVVVGIFGTLDDISENKRAEEALNRSETKHRALLNAIPDMMMRVERTGIVLDFKAEHGHTQAMSTDEQNRTLIFDILPQEIASQLLVSIRQTLDTNEAGTYEYQTLHQGLTRDQEARLITDGDGNVLIIVRDITERKNVERMKNEFVSVVSHELRTPLTSIRGSLGLIANGVAGQLPVQAKGMIDIAYNNSERLVRLINDMLDIEKIESGKMTFDMRPLNLSQILDQAIEDNRGYSIQFGVSIAHDYTVSDVMVYADSDRLLQVFTNLLSNAIKFSPQGDTVTVTMRHSPTGVRVAVADNGPGIPEAFRPQIFEKFAQADSSDTRQKQGTGLGLSISKAIIEKCDGLIGFTSETGVGTTFYVDLPEWRSAEDVDDEDDDEDEPMTTASKRVLVCEDDQDVALLLKLLLAQCDCDVIIASTVAETRDMLQREHFDAITLDLNLPDQDGISFIHELRSHERTRLLPIIVVSAKADRVRDELDGEAFLIVDWLNKPIDHERFITTVRTAIHVDGQTKPRVLYVEDDSELRQIVAALLHDIADVVPAGSLYEARKRLSATLFDLVILDVVLPDGTGLDLVPLLNNQHPATPILIFSGYEMSRITSDSVAAVLIKSRTSNHTLRETIATLITHSRRDGSLVGA